MNTDLKRLRGVVIRNMVILPKNINL